MRSTCRGLLFLTVLGTFAGAANATGVLVSPPPSPPTWWNNPPANAQYWGFANSLGEQAASFTEFGVTKGETNTSKPDAPNKDFIGTYFTFTMQNGYQKDLDKTFYFYVSGTGASLPPAASGSPASAISTGHDASVINYSTPFTPTVDTNGNWTATLEGTAHPQPDKIIYTFTVWGQSMGPNTVTLTSWYAGEYCVPEPVTLSVIGVAAALGGRRRR